MDESRKRFIGECNNGNDVLAKRSRMPASFGGEVGEYEALTEWLSIDEAAVTELSKLLETEFVSPVKVRFVSYPYSSSSNPMFQPSASYITINCNDETCGSSFSDSDSSLMASVDTGGIHISNYDDGRCRSFSSQHFQQTSRACGLDGVKARGFDEAKMICGEDSETREISGSDCSDFCDEMLARFLGEDLPED